MDIPRIITNIRQALSDSTICVRYRNFPRDYSHKLQRNTVPVRYGTMLGSVRYRTVLYFVVFYGKVRYRVPLFGDIDTKRAQCTATPN